MIDWLGLRFCARAFSRCGKRGPLFTVVRGPLTTVASLVAEHRLQTRRLSSCGSRASSLRGMWDPPRPGLEPVSPASAGRFSTTVPPGKPKGPNYYGIDLVSLSPSLTPTFYPCSQSSQLWQWASRLPRMEVRWAFPDFSSLGYG